MDLIKDPPRLLAMLPDPDWLARQLFEATQKQPPHIRRLVELKPGEPHLGPPEGLPVTPNGYRWETDQEQLMRQTSG